MNQADTSHGLSIYRGEALADGIYAVTMTLLVIELKLPDHTLIQGANALAQALSDLLPKVLAWVISFFVLAFFWFGHHRVFLCEAGRWQGGGAQHRPAGVREPDPVFLRADRRA